MRQAGGGAVYWHRCTLCLHEAAAAVIKTEVVIAIYSVRLTKALKGDGPNSSNINTTTPKTVIHTASMKNKIVHLKFIQGSINI